MNLHRLDMSNLLMRLKARRWLHENLTPNRYWFTRLRDKFSTLKRKPRKSRPTRQRLCRFGDGIKRRQQYAARMREYRIGKKARGGRRGFRRSLRIRHHELPFDLNCDKGRELSGHTLWFRDDHAAILFKLGCDL